MTLSIKKSPFLCSFVRCNLRSYNKDPLVLYHTRPRFGYLAMHKERTRRKKQHLGAFVLQGYQALTNFLVDLDSFSSL